VTLCSLADVSEERSAAIKSNSNTNKQSNFNIGLLIVAWS
jgi:hypothetical protein